MEPHEINGAEYEFDYLVQTYQEMGWTIEQTKISKESCPTYTPFFTIMDGPLTGVAFMENKRIMTSDSRGAPNGHLLEIQSENHGFMVPNTTSNQRGGIQQVYMTVCAPGKKKGLHLHHAKEENFTCISGNVVITLLADKAVLCFPMGELFGYRTIKVPPEIGHGIKNSSKRHEAKVINCTYPPYDPGHLDQIDLDVKW